VFRQQVFRRIFFLAGFTLVWFVPRVGPHMYVQAHLRRKILIAHGTFERLLLDMYSQHVDLKISFSAEPLAAHIANVLLRRMNGFVLFQRRRRRQNLSTLLTHETLSHTLVRLQMSL
jgi:hypothetical protein